jgi:hypothetical protein
VAGYPAGTRVSGVCGPQTTVAGRVNTAWYTTSTRGAGTNMKIDGDPVGTVLDNICGPTPYPAGSVTIGSTCGRETGINTIRRVS